MFTKTLSDIEILAFTNSKGFAVTDCPNGQVGMHTHGGLSWIVNRSAMGEWCIGLYRIALDNLACLRALFLSCLADDDDVLFHKQLKDACGVCGGNNGNIAPESNSLCCEPIALPTETNPDPNATVLGDVNSDGIYSVLDIIPLANYLLEITTLSACQEVYGDINQDGECAH